MGDVDVMCARRRRVASTLHRAVSARSSSLAAGRLRNVRQCARASVLSSHVALAFVYCNLVLIHSRRSGEGGQSCLALASLPSHYHPLRASPFHTLSSAPLPPFAVACLAIYHNNFWMNARAA